MNTPSKPSESHTAPSHLKGAPLKLWREITAAYVLSPSELVTLEMACDAMATHEVAREVVLAEGVVSASGVGTMKASPAERVARDARLDFARLMRVLDLDDLPEDVL
jgi:phage terminase small subunit